MAGIGVMAEGPVSDRGSFLFSARKSYLDLIISDFGITAIPHYYNFQGKLTYELSDRHTLLWNTVYGSDKIEIRPDENEDDPEDDDNVNSSSNLLVSGFTLTSTLSQSLLSRAVLSFVKNTWREDVWELGKTKSDMYYNNRSKESEITLKYDLPGSRKTRTIGRILAQEQPVQSRYFRGAGHSNTYDTVSSPPGGYHYRHLPHLPGLARRQEREHTQKRGISPGPPPAVQPAHPPSRRQV